MSLVLFFIAGAMADPANCAGHTRRYKCLAEGDCLWEGSQVNPSCARNDLDCTSYTRKNNCELDGNCLYVAGACLKKTGGSCSDYGLKKACNQIAECNWFKGCNIDVSIYEAFDCETCNETPGYQYCRYTPEGEPTKEICLPQVYDGENVPCGEEEGDELVASCPTEAPPSEWTMVEQKRGAQTIRGAHLFPPAANCVNYFDMCAWEGVDAAKAGCKAFVEVHLPSCKAFSCLAGEPPLCLAYYDTSEDTMTLQTNAVSYILNARAED